MIDKRNIKSILLVCTGNSCRSVMAQGYLIKRLKDLGKQISVESVGTAAPPGAKPTKETVESMKELNIDVSEYLSKLLTKGDMDKADIILVMDPIHREKIRNIDPSSAIKDKIFYLRQFVKGDSREIIIPDPIGRPLDFYKRVLDIIKESIEGFLEWLEN